MVLKIDNEQMKKLIKQYYKTKKALFVYGTYGIGKSYGIYASAEDIAKEKGKEFVDWNRIGKEEKAKIFENPKDYFVYLDIRLSEYDSSDIKGLPNFKSDNESIEWKTPYWANFLTLPESDGILNFEEFNLATPIVMASCYKIIYDRIVNESKINKNWLMIGCGNLESDNAFTHTIPSPLKDRAGEVELTISDVENWTNWASKNGIDSRIVGFVNFKPSNLHKRNEDNQKDVTLRGWERLSCLIKDVTDKETFELVCCSAICEGIAREFISFCELSDKMNLEEFIKNPSKIKDIEEISVKYLLVTSLADRYNDKKVDFNKVLEVSKVLDEIGNPEFVSLMWRMAYNYTERFGEDFLASKDKLIDKFSKYLI